MTSELRQHILADKQSVFIANISFLFWQTRDTVGANWVCLSAYSRAMFPEQLVRARAESYAQLCGAARSAAAVAWRLPCISITDGSC